jgi:hypothetical protein
MCRESPGCLVETVSATPQTTSLVVEVTLNTLNDEPTSYSFDVILCTKGHKKQGCEGVTYMFAGGSVPAGSQHVTVRQELTGLPEDFSKKDGGHGVVIASNAQRTEAPCFGLKGHGNHC